MRSLCFIEATEKILNCYTRKMLAGISWKVWKDSCQILAGMTGKRADTHEVVVLI